MLNIDVEVTLRGLNMLIGEIDCVLVGAGDEIAVCWGRWNLCAGIQGVFSV